MSLHCPVCGAPHLKTLPYVLASGTYQVKVYNIIGTPAPTQPGVLCDTSEDEDSGWHYETHITEFAQLAKPPTRKTMDGPLLGIIIAAVILGLSQLQFYTDVLLGCGIVTGLASLVWAMANYRYNHSVFPERLERWENSFLCLACHHIMEPEVLAVRPADPV